MRKQRHAVPAAFPAPGFPHGPAATRVLRRTARAWLSAALPRRAPEPPLDERVRRAGEW